MFVLANSTNEMTEMLKLHYSPLSWQRAAFIRVELRYTWDGRREGEIFSHTLNVQTKSGNILDARLISESPSTKMLPKIPIWTDQIINFHGIKNRPLKQGIFKWGKEKFNWCVSFRDKFIHTILLLTLDRYMTPLLALYTTSLILLKRHLFSLQFWGEKKSRVNCMC